MVLWEALVYFPVFPSLPPSPFDAMQFSKVCSS